MPEPEPCIALMEIWEAVETCVPAHMSAAFRRGMAGAGLPRNGEPALHSDLTCLLLPGLAAFGIHAELDPLPQNPLSPPPSPPRRATHERFLLAFSGPPEPAECEPEAEARDDDPTPAPDPRIVGFAVAPGPPSVSGAMPRSPHEALPANIDPFGRDFTHALTWRRGAAKGFRRANIRAALARWLVFYAAYPDRHFGDGPADGPRRDAAATFLREIAGRAGDPIAIRLRRAADALEDANVEGALDPLRDAVLRGLFLPAGAYAALRSPPDTRLDAMQRSELIYLARAGTRELKVLAARRLQSERERREVQQTLDQLCFDRDAWVRAAAS